MTDVARNYEINRQIPPFTAAPDDDRPWRIQPADVGRLYEFRRCIECYLCQDVCHVIRTHGRFDRYYGPRYFVRIAGLEMHPKDILDRTEQTRNEGGLGYCNITKCCTEVCPEHIKIRENAIIPLKERGTYQQSARRDAAWVGFSVQARPRRLLPGTTFRQSEPDDQ